MFLVRLSRRRRHHPRRHTARQDQTKAAGRRPGSGIVDSPYLDPPGMAIEVALGAIVSFYRAVPIRAATGAAAGVPPRVFVSFGQVACISLRWWWGGCAVGCGEWDPRCGSFFCAATAGARRGVKWDRVSGQPALTRPLSQAVAIRACLWREVVPRQRGKGLTRSRV